MHMHIAMYLLEQGTNQNDEYYKLQKNSSNLALFIMVTMCVVCEMVFLLFSKQLGGPWTNRKTCPRALLHSRICQHAGQIQLSVPCSLST